jgi:REP element-mobilizing transposase RayT
MPQSLANILVHVIFSTKNRARLILPDIEGELYPYLASICRVCDSPSHAIGGIEDHVHIALTLGRTITVAKLLAEIKASSSKWIKTKGPQYVEFAWQNGYGAFSIGQSQSPALKRYIARQKEHHRQRTYQEEFREFLKRYGIAYDERYVWD